MHIDLKSISVVAGTLALVGCSPHRDKHDLHDPLKHPLSEIELKFENARALIESMHPTSIFITPDSSSAARAILTEAIAHLSPECADDSTHTNLYYLTEPGKKPSGEGTRILYRGTEELNLLNTGFSEFGQGTLELGLRVSPEEIQYHTDSDGSQRIIISDSNHDDLASATYSLTEFFEQQLANDRVGVIRTLLNSSGSTFFVVGEQIITIEFSGATDSTSVGKYEIDIKDFSSTRLQKVFLREDGTPYDTDDKTLRLLDELLLKKIDLDENGRHSTTITI